MHSTRRRWARSRDETAEATTRPSLVQPGCDFRPLADSDLARIHRAALYVLERVGMGDPTPEIAEIAVDKGCWISATGRLCFPRALVEDILAVACRQFVAYAPNPRNDLTIGGNTVTFATAGEAVLVFDAARKRYRPSRLVDLYDFARLVDRLEHLHSFGQNVIATDLPDRLTADLNVAYACLAGTEKPFGISIENAGHLRHVIDLFDTYCGAEGAFVRRPFCIIGGCPVISPLRFASDSAGVMVALARLGLVVDVAIAAQAGATAPAALAGTLVQTTAETLAPLVITNLVRSGNPMTFGIWPLVSDLRTGAFSGGGGEEALLSAAAAQICRFYDLPGSTAAGMTDAKEPDAQAGYEKGVSVTLAALAGANFVNESAGMLASLMGSSFESMVIDNDMLGMVQRVMRGIEVTDETLSLEEIKACVEGPGHYLGMDQTLRLMRTEYLYPRVANRESAGSWEERGARSLLQSAGVRAGSILSEHFPAYIAEATDRRLRDRFPIQLAREEMAPGCQRWTR